MERAIIRTATGLVENIIIIGEGADWPCPDGCELVDAVPPAQAGATWDGTNFIAPIIPETPRLDILMAAGPATQVYDEETELLVARPASDIAAEKTELLGLLQAKLAASEDLTWDQMNKMLALERES